MALALAIIAIIIEAFVLYSVMLVFYTSLPFGEDLDDTGPAETSSEKQREEGYG